MAPHGGASILSQGVLVQTLLKILILHGIFFANLLKKIARKDFFL